MQSTRLGRWSLLVMLAGSLTACDQVMSQLDHLIPSGHMDCQEGESSGCESSMRQSQDLNWFLREVKNQ